MEFLITGIGINQGMNSRQDALIYGPDISGTYGGMQGVGGLETVTSLPFNTSAVMLNDTFGNVLGAVTNGTVTWNASRVNLYSPVEGYTPPRLSLSSPVYTSLAWRTRAATPAGLFQLGFRPYDPMRRAFLSGDPLGHDSDATLNTAFNGNPATFFDPTGLYGKQTGDWDSINSWINDLRHSDPILWRKHLADYGLQVGYSYADLPFSVRLAMIVQQAGMHSEASYVDVRPFSVKARSFAADAFLNADLLQQSWYELNNPDFSSGIGVATFATAAVGMVAGSIDAASNLIPGKAIVENGIKSGIKGVGSLVVKDVAKEVVEIETKQLVQIEARQITEITSRTKWGPEHGKGNVAHNNAIENLLDAAEERGATSLRKNRVQRDAEGQRVYANDGSYTKPDAAYVEEKTRYNYNRVSNLNDLDRELDAFRKMREADPKAVNILEF